MKSDTKPDVVVKIYYNYEDKTYRLYFKVYRNGILFDNGTLEGDQVKNTRKVYDAVLMGIKIKA